MLAQRNALLRRLSATRAATPASSRSGTAEMAEHGSVLLGRRAQAVKGADRLAAERHRDLTGGAERLRLTYLPTLTRPRGPPPLRRGGKRYLR